MSKRFTATEKWIDPWFCGLSIIDRLFWIYLCDNCDLAGVWQVNRMLVQTYFPGYELTPAVFGDRLRILTPEKWLLTKFVLFQYGTLNTNNRMHQAVIARLEKEGASKGHPSPYQGAKDKDKDIYKEDVKDVEGSGGFNFDAVWTRYPKRKGRKEAERHFKATVKTPQDYADIQNALDNYIAEIRRDHIDPQFVKHGSTWFNNWRDDVAYRGVQLPKPPAPPPRPPDPPEEPLTEAEQIEMHKMTLSVLKKCPTPGCELCAKIRKLEGVPS